MENKTYTITEISEITGLSKHTLRYYENIGLLGEVPRSNNGHRFYTAKMLDMIKHIMMLRATGLPIKQLKRYVKLLRGEATKESLSERGDILFAQRDKLKQHIQELTDNLGYLEAKVEWYQKEVSHYTLTGEELEKQF